MTAEPGYIAKLQRQRRHAELMLLWKSHAWKVEATGVAVTAALANPTPYPFHVDLAATAAGVYAVSQLGLLTRARNSIGHAANRLINSQHLQYATSMIPDRPAWTHDLGRCPRRFCPQRQSKAKQHWATLRKHFLSAKDTAEERLINYAGKSKRE